MSYYLILAIGILVLASFRAGRCRHRGRCRVNMIELTRCPSCLARVGHCRCGR